MSDPSNPSNPSNPVNAAPAGGVSGIHPAIDFAPLLVGPSTGSEFNTLSVAVIPIACWRIDDIRFEFDSCFVRPEVSTEMVFLKDLIQAHPKAPLSVFGHADPVGDDEYNKQLSGRRALAIYAMLIRDTAKWESLYNDALDRSTWHIKSEQIILDTLGFPPGRMDGVMDDPTRDALRRFQTSHGLAASGNTSAATRTALFGDYFEKVCGPDLKLSKTDFLAQGADPDGKGDVQGCGEFNPVVVFSKDEDQAFQSAPDKHERNNENAPNRRVMVFLFRPGTRVKPAKWPCPKVKEGTGSCRKRFWSDAEKRRNPQALRRSYSDDKNTFACRFYDRLASESPCEKPAPTPARVIKIRATVPSTPPQTPRAAPPAVANAWAAPVDRVFESTRQLGRGAVAFQPSDFAQPDALVLIRNSGGPIQLEAETNPAGAAVVFAAVRATDDAAALGTGLPTVTSTGTNTATLATDERGSFFILAFIDSNGNGRRDTNEIGGILPVVLVECRIETPATEFRSVANPANIAITFDGNAGSVAAANYNFVSISTGDFNSQATAGIALDADVLLIGGGPDGRRGLDRTFTGWANNFTALTYAGTYQDGSVVSRIQLDNRGAANGTAISGIPVFVTRPGATAPNPIAFPPQLLDTGRANPDQGGENITFTRSSEAAPVAQALGDKRTVTARDSPGWFHQHQHPDATRHTTLQSFVHSLNSTTYLVAWTNTTGGAPPTPGTANSVGFRTFTVIAETQWTVTAQFNVTQTGGNFQLQSTGAAQTITANNVDHANGVTPASIGMEVRPPETLLSRAIDAR